MGRHFLVIGIGESGIKTVRSFSHKAKQSNIAATCLTIDTDESILQSDPCVHPISLARNERLFESVQTLNDVQLKAWFPYDFEDTQNEFLKTLRMDNGANLWRSKALLHFACYMADAENRNVFCGMLDAALAECKSKEIELYVVASLAGGTGSALFLPVTLFIQNYIRQTIGGEAEAKAFLYASELYADALSAEQKVKANANAYAALRELNAVHLTALSGSKADLAAASGIRFTLGSPDDSAIGLLFDADNPVFRNPAAMPFSSVYILERQAGIRSIDTHIEILGDVLASLCSDAGGASGNPYIRKSPDALFGAVMLTKIMYPSKSIAEYIAVARLCDTVQSEWLWLHKEVMRMLEDDAKRASQTAAPLQDEETRYCEHLLERIRDLSAGSADCAALLGKKNAFAPTVSTDFSDAEYLYTVDRTVASFLCGEGAKAISDMKERIAAALAAPSVFGKVHLSLPETASACKEILQTVYRDALHAFRAHESSFGAAIEASEGVLSLSENVLHDDGRPIHPVFALVRLCTLRAAIVAASDAVSACLSDTDDADDALPDTDLLLQPVPEKDKKCKYARGEEERFLLLASGDRSVCGKTATDLALLGKDLDVLVAAVTAPVKVAFWHLLADRVDVRIAQYVRFFRRLAAAEDSMAALKNEALRKDSYTAGIRCFVFASETDRRLAAASFAKAVADGEEDDIFTLDFYRETEAAIFSGVAVEDLLASLAAKAAEQVMGSRFYAKHLDKNILEVLLTPDPAVCAAEGGSGMRLRKAFHAAAPFLKISMSDTGTGAAMRTRTAVQFSAGICTFLTEHRSDFGLRGEDAGDIIENLLYMSDEYADDIGFSDEVPANCMYIRKELGNLCLGEIEFFNEAAQPPVGKNDCDKALRMMQTQFTEMWNPFLFRYAESGLPLIRADLQEQRERQTVKALLFALASRQILSVTDDAAGTAVYEYLHDGFAEPVLDGDKAVPAGDFAALLHWLRQNDAPAALWESAFTEQLEKDCGSLPSADIGNMQLQAVLDAVDKTETVRMLRDFLLVLALSAENAGARARVLYTGLETVAALCESRLSVTDHAYAEMFRHIGSRMTERFRELAGDTYGAAHIALINEFYAHFESFLPTYNEP